MTTIDQLIGEFIDDWKAGRRPDVGAFLERADPSDRDDLAAQLMTWLEVAPTPDYDAATRKEIAAEPALTSALATAAQLRAPLAERLPTLRERVQDVGDLAAYFLSEFCARNNFRPKAIDEAVVPLLERYDWPGNIRELRNTVERMAILSPGERITAEALPNTALMRTASSTALCASAVMAPSRAPGMNAVGGSTPCCG